MTFRLRFSGFTENAVAAALRAIAGLKPDLYTGLPALMLTFLLAVAPLPVHGQERTQEKETTKATEKEKPAEEKPPKEESSTTEHSIKIGGQTIPYKAVAQTILLKNEKDEPQALI